MCATCATVPRQPPPHQKATPIITCTVFPPSTLTRRHPVRVCTYAARQRNIRTVSSTLSSGRAGAALVFVSSNSRANLCLNKSSIKVALWRHHRRTDRANVAPDRLCRSECARGHVVRRPGALPRRGRGWRQILIKWATGCAINGRAELAAAGRTLCVGVCA